MKHYPKDCSSYTANLVWLQSSTREPWRLQYFKSLFLEMSIVTIWLVFPNPVTNVHTDVRTETVVKQPCICLYAWFKNLKVFFGNCPKFLKIKASKISCYDMVHYVSFHIKITKKLYAMIIIYYVH